MLIEFSVSNYRSFSSQQTLLMEAITNKRKEEKRENKLCTSISWLANKTKEVELLRSVVIYGANNSGKTNLIKSITVFQNVVLHSFKNDMSGDRGSPQYFLLDEALKDKPCLFKAVFIVDGVKYSYAFATNFKEIIFEELISFPLGSPKILLTRKDTSQLKVGKRRKLIADSTKSGSLLLSTAIGLKTDSEILDNVYKFITQDIALDTGGASSDFKTKDMILNEKNELIKEVFKEAIGDGIIDVRIKKIESDAEKIVNFTVKDGGVKTLDPSKLPQNVQEQIRKQSEINRHKVKLIRKNSLDQEIEFDLNDYESGGTKKLFNYIGPIIDVLDKGKILIADELDNSLHPKLMEFVIKLFHSKETNPNNAQLIFTTHDTSLIGKNLDLFRRDQIWFVDKGYDNNTELYPLTDYYTRGEADFADYYLSGRYGAIREVKEDI